MRLDTPAGPVSFEQVGSGPDLVLLHSLLTDRRVYDRVLPELAARWRVTLVDLPGYGQTPRTEPTIDAFADVIGGLLGAGDFDPGRTAVLGNGLGGFVALGTAVRHGALFNQLVLAGCGSAIPEAGKGAFEVMIGKVRDGGMAAVVEQAVARIFPADFLAANPEAAEERRTVLLQTDPEAFADACSALKDLDYRPVVPDVRNPTLLLVGSEDEATPPALSRDLHQAIPTSSYVELPGIGHGPQLQDPAGFVDAVRAFLDAA